MRPIDADALIKYLNDDWLAVSPCGNGNSETDKERAAMCRGIDRAIKTVAAFPAASSGWISVKDRLPKDETEVVIIVQHKIGWYRAFAWHDEYGWHSSAEEFGNGESDFVTHWMPLPEPPKEDENGDKADPV